MGNCCFPEKKTRYTYLVVKNWSISSTDSYEERSSNISSSSCRICQKRITAHTVIAKCNECNVCIGHASCINQDQECILCLR